MAGSSPSLTPYTLNRSAIWGWCLFLLTAGLGAWILFETLSGDRGFFGLFLGLLPLAAAFWIYRPARHRWTLDEEGISRGSLLIPWTSVTGLELRTFPRGYRSPGNLDLHLEAAGQRLLMRIYSKRDARELADRFHAALPETLFPACRVKQVAEVWKW